MIRGMRTPTWTSRRSSGSRYSPRKSVFDSDIALFGHELRAHRAGEHMGRTPVTFGEVNRSPDAFVRGVVRATTNSNAQIRE